LPEEIRSALNRSVGGNVGGRKYPRVISFTILFIVIAVIAWIIYDNNKSEKRGAKTRRACTMLNYD
jgi:hypothetical protein